MKDLIKGHNPLMLFFVALMSLFFAFAVRNKIVSESHTDLNANFFFFMVLASCIGVYFLIHEGIKEFTDFFVKKSWKKRGITPQTATIPDASNKESNNSEIEKPTTESQPLTREDARMLLTEVLAVKAEKASDDKEELVKTINENMLDLSNVAANAANEIEAGLQRTFQEACLYTIEVLGPYMTKENLEILISRLSKFQRAGNKTWSVLSASETVHKKVETHSPITKTDLYHYGWNMQQLFSKSGPQAAYFLQSTFHEHFEDLQLKTIKGKLTLDADKGIIKINKEFSPNYRSRVEREKEQNAQQMAKEYEEEQKQKKFERGQEHYQKMTRKKAEAESEPIAKTQVSVPIQEANNRSVRDTHKSKPKRYDDFDDEEDEWNDTNDEPADDAFIYAMLERSEKRNQKSNEPTPWSPGDSLAVERDW